MPKSVRSAFVELMQDLQAYSLTHTPAELLDYALQRSDYAVHVKVCGWPAAVARRVQSCTSQAERCSAPAVPEPLLSHLYDSLSVLVGLSTTCM